jgi:predicted amidohydrolase YtcJ
MPNSKHKRPLSRLLVNGQFHTMDPAKPDATAVAIHCAPVGHDDRWAVGLSA